MVTETLETPALAGLLSADLDGDSRGDLVVSTDENGDVIGGEYLMTGSLEFEHYFSDNLGMAVFIDAGNALESFADDLEQGAGFGLRWRSPVGPVRIDIANAISDDNDWRLHLDIGPDL